MRLMLVLMISTCGILVESDDTFSEEHSLHQPFVMDFSEVTPPDELSDPISDESFPDLAPNSPISSLSSLFPIFPPSIDLLSLLYGV